MKNADSQLRWVYGISHFGKSLLWAVSGLVLAFFLTEVVAFSPQQMGRIVGASLLFQAALDLIIGRAMRNRVQTVRQAAIAQLYGAVCAAAGFVFFSSAGLIPDSAKALYALATLFLFRLGCSIYDIPQNTFMAFVTKTDTARAQYSSMRYIMSGLAALLITLVVTPLVRSDPGIDNGIRFAQLSVIIGIIAVLGSYCLFAVARHHPPQQKRITPITLTATNPMGSLNVVFSRPFLGVVFSIFVLNLTASVFSNLEAYFVAYSLHEVPVGAIFLTCVAGGQVVSQPGWALMVHKWGLKPVLMLASVAYLGSGLAFAALGHLGGVATISSALIYGAGYGGTAMCIWGLLAKVAATDPSRATQRYGLFTCFSKLSQATAILIVGAALTDIAYRDSAIGQTQLQYFMALAPVLGGLILLTFIAISRMPADTSQRPSKTES
ncbi:MAG: MFS transporter [Henriciella sp.]